MTSKNKILEDQEWIIKYKFKDYQADFVRGAVQTNLSTTKVF